MEQLTDAQRALLDEIDGFALRPETFAPRVRGVLGATGETAQALRRSVTAL